MSVLNYIVPKLWLFASVINLAICNIQDVTVEPVPVCDSPKILNSHLIGKNNSFFEGEHAIVECDADYRFRHTQFHPTVVQLECEAGGTWVYIRPEDIPTCQRIGSCPTPTIAMGQVLNKEGGYMPGDLAPVQCDGGSPLYPNIVCQNDGTWKTVTGLTNIQPCTHKLQHCDLPAGIKNGGFNSLADTVTQLKYIPEGSQVLFFCNSGYVLEKDSSELLTCRNGKFQGPKPNCVLQQNTSYCSTPEAVNNSYCSTYGGSSVNPTCEDSTFLEGTKVVYFCNSGYELYGDPSRTCHNSKWSNQPPTCIPGCSEPPAVRNGKYNFFGQNDIGKQDWIPEGSSAYYFCGNGYKMKMKSMSSLMCVKGSWTGTLPVCEKRMHCDPPMDIPNGNWIILNIYPDFRIGSRVRYECEKDFKPIGAQNIECLSTGYWSDYAPRCLPKDMYCSEPQPIENGFYMCDPYHCDMFKVGTQVHYICNKNYEAQPGDVTVMTCQHKGIWTEVDAKCLRAAGTTESSELELSSSTLTIVVVTSCTIVGMLLVVLLVVIFQRRHKPSHRHYMQHIPGVPAPEGYERVHEARIVPTLDEHDRVALIAFADGVQVVLPSYEEAVRRPQGSRLHRYNSDSSRSSRQSGNRGEYRPLPTLPYSVRHAAYLREIPPDQRDHHRNSIVTTTSSATRGGDNLSLAFGSMDTMNVSDNTSTTVTLGTYDSGASNPSLALSHRAAAGSLASSNPSLATEDAPLIEQADPAVTLRSQTASPSIPEENEDEPCTEQEPHK